MAEKYENMNCFLRTKAYGIRSALNGLHETHLKELEKISHLLNRANRNGLTLEYEQKRGELKGYLNCLYQLQIISKSNYKALFLWFLEADRSIHVKVKKEA